jgi:hypothetical protein
VADHWSTAAPFVVFIAGVAFICIVGFGFQLWHILRRKK